MLSAACVLGAFYEVPRERVPESMRAVIALSSVKTLGSGTPLRALEAHEVDHLGFAEAHSVAQGVALTSW